MINSARTKTPKEDCLQLISKLSKTKQSLSSHFKGDKASYSRWSYHLRKHCLIAQTRAKRRVRTLSKAEYHKAWRSSRVGNISFIRSQIKYLTRELAEEEAKARAATIQDQVAVADTLVLISRQDICESPELSNAESAPRGVPPKSTGITRIVPHAAPYPSTPAEIAPQTR